MPERNKHIYLLIGPKGSGKSYVGRLFNTYFNIPFFRVENWVMEVRKERDLFDPEYIREAFETIERKIREVMREVDQLVFESTGLTDDFDRMLISLQSDYQVTTIKVNCSKDTCLERVRNRDQSNHINVSDHEVEEINSAVFLKDFTPDYSIENSDSKADKLKEEIRAILYNTTQAIP